MNRILVELFHGQGPVAYACKTTFEINGKLTRAKLVEAMSDEVASQAALVGSITNKGAKANAAVRFDRLQNLAAVVRKNFGRKAPNEVEVSGGRHLRYWDNPLGGHDRDILVISQSPRYA